MANHPNKTENFQQVYLTTNKKTLPLLPLLLLTK